MTAFPSVPSPCLALSQCLFFIVPAPSLLLLFLRLGEAIFHRVLQYYNTTCISSSQEMRLLRPHLRSTAARSISKPATSLCTHPWLPSCAELWSWRPPCRGLWRNVLHSYSMVWVPATCGKTGKVARRCWRWQTRRQPVQCTVDTSHKTGGRRGSVRHSGTFSLDMNTLGKCGLGSSTGKDVPIGEAVLQRRGPCSWFFHFSFCSMNQQEQHPFLSLNYPFPN